MTMPDYSEKKRERDLYQIGLGAAKERRPPFLNLCQ
jgi:hypothetical protein